MLAQIGLGGAAGGIAILPYLLLGYFALLVVSSYFAFWVVLGVPRWGRHADYIAYTLVYAVVSLFVAVVVAQVFRVSANWLYFSTRTDVRGLRPWVACLPFAVLLVSCVIAIVVRCRRRSNPRV